MATLAWLTPESAPDGLVCFSVFCPNDDFSIWNLQGQIAEFLNEVKHQNVFGNVTAADMVAWWQQAYDATIPLSECEQGATVSRYIGEVFLYGGTTPPAGCLECDGSQLSATTYADLFDVIGYGFGGEDGTFYLPDMTDAYAKGYGSEGAIGAKYGNNNLRTVPLPAHYHELYNQAPSGAQQRVLPLANTAGFETQTSVEGVSNPTIDIEPRRVTFMFCIVYEVA